MLRTVPTGDLGLDVLLGGGWRLVKRLGDAESTTVVVRGGSGAGKTLLGIHVALELARALGGDVVVGCVEILPTEYIAQLQSARPSLPAERIALLPKAASTADGPRVYVGLMLDLDPEQPDLNASLATLREATATAGGKPVVFLVDSLIEGYGIGSSAPRIAVDDCMKFAAKHGVRAGAVRGDRERRAVAVGVRRRHRAAGRRRVARARPVDRGQEAPVRPVGDGAA
jgi:hypothetical protein